jgi:hypothetical protein
MVTKLAAFVLIGSVVALTVGGLTGKTRRRFEDWDFKDRVHIKREIRHRLRHEERALRERIEHVERVRVQVGSAHEEPALAQDEQLVGTYVFDASGNPFGKLPWSAHVELQLQPGSKYELRVRQNIDQELSEETSWGRYSVDGDRIKLTSAHDEDTHEFRIDGDKLVFDADWSEKLALKAVGVQETFMKKVQ